MSQRPGGYTRVFKLGRRKGDSAQMVILEMVDRDVGTAKRPHLAALQGRSACNLFGPSAQAEPPG